jgi:transposase InsO family protein
VSDVRAGWSDWIVRRCATSANVRTTQRCGNGCASWPRNDAASGIVGWEEKLMVRRRGRRKRALGTRAPMRLPEAVNQRWSLDFVSDALSDGRRFRILCIVDDFSRECLAAVVDTSLGGVRVVRELEAWRSSARCLKWWSATTGPS